MPPAQNHGYDPLSYPEVYWPATSQYPQYYRSGIRRDNSFVSTVASEDSTATSTLSSSKYFFLLRDFEESDAHQPRTVPLDYWGDSASGLSTNMLYAVSARD